VSPLALSGGLQFGERLVQNSWDSNQFPFSPVTAGDLFLSRSIQAPENRGFGGVNRGVKRGKKGW